MEEEERINTPSTLKREEKSVWEENCSSLSEEEKDSEKE